MRKNILQTSLVISILVTCVSCGGGGGSSDPGISDPGIRDPGMPGPGDGNLSLELSWEIPTLREDETLLPPEDIQGYVIVWYAKSTEDELINELINTYSLENYPESPEQINTFVSTYMLYDLLKADLDNTVIIESASQTTLLLENILPDTYYFAISAVDTKNRISDLSQTAEIIVSGP